MIHFGGDEKAVNKSLGSPWLLERGDQQGLVKVRCDYMVLMFGAGRLPVDIIPALVDGTDDCIPFPLISDINFYLITHGYRVCTGNIIDLENPFDPCIIDIPISILYRVPATG